MSASRAGAVAFTSRFAHTSTLLPDGNILVVGGMTAPGDLTTALTGVQISLERQNDFLDATAMAVARASHTATMLPTGQVLIVGGVNSGGVRTDAVVFDPSQNCWSASMAMTEVNGRFNHTATLLKTGKVLVCGGQRGSGAMNSSCELYNAPTNPSFTCGGAFGSFSATGSLASARSLHTSTLLPDGRVFLAGGWDPNNATYPYLVTTEIYNPTSGTFKAGKNLIQQRAYHTANLMGNGKVLITGGFNGRDSLANKGILQTTELYDPVSDSMVPAPSMLVRSLGHSMTLQNDGQLAMFGGLGNITTTFVNASATLVDGSSVTGSFGNVLSTMNVTGGYLAVNLNFPLSVPVTGIIEQGEVLMSSPIVNFTYSGVTGQAILRAGTADPAVGLRASLAGTRVFCDPVAGTCGQISRTVSLSPMQGQYFTPDVTVSPDNFTLIANSTVGFTASPMTVDNSPGTILTASILTGTLTVPISKIFLGAAISSGSLRLTAGSLSITNIATLSFTDGFTQIPGAPTVVDDGAGGAEFSFNASFINLRGTVDVSTTTNQVTPFNVAGRVVTGLSGTLKFVASRVNLSQTNFTVDVATVVIRSMMFSDLTKFNPQSNAWSFTVQGFGSQKHGHSATLTPSGDISLLGGLSCTDSQTSQTDCTSSSPRGSARVIPRLGAWTANSAGMTNSRGNHTTTMLPNGNILVAGGSNGPNVLRSAELFDPVTARFSATGPMLEVRDLHTATLLPNGRVLVSGGFTTNATSTGATAGAEIYYPATGIWVPTQSMNTARDNHAAVLMADGNVLATGGYNGGTYHNEAEIYYSTAGAWRPISSMNLARALHTSTLLQDGRILVSGGVNASGVLARNEIYNPVTGAWTMATCLNNAADPCAGSAKRSHSHSATLLMDGRVLLTGGNDGFGETAYSLIYDPVANTWTDTGALVPGRPLNTPRFSHTATLLPNGNVIIAGGAQALGNTLNSCETFDVATSSWQVSGNMSASRGYHTTSLAKDGNLYAIGGYSGAAFLSSAERLYFTGSPDAASLGAPPSARQSTITAVDLSPFNRGDFVTLSGRNFQGITEASSGGPASGNSSHFHPRAVLQAVDGSGGTSSQGSGGFALDLSTRVYSKTPDPNLWTKTDSSMTVLMPSAAQSPLPSPGGTFLPYGWYHLRSASNSQFSDSVLVQAGPPKPTVGPTSVTANTVSITSTTITWSWTDIQGQTTMDGYEVFSATTGVFISTVGAATPTYTQRGLAPNATAQLLVGAYTLTGDGPLTTSATFFTLSTVPVSVAVTSVTSTSLLLSWNVNGNSQGTIYEVSLSTDNFALSFSTPVPSLSGLTTDNVILAPLQSNTTYYLRLRSFNGAGTASNFSVVVATQTRTPVAGLAGTGLTTTSIQWSWVDPGGVNFYKVYNSTTGAVIATPNTNVFQDTGLSTNSVRSVYVSAVTQAGEGPLSASATTFTLSAIPLAVSPPILNVTTGSFTGIWNTNENPAGTTFEMIVSSGDAVVSTITTTGFSASVADLASPAMPFDVKVRSLNGDSVASSYLVLGTTSTLANPPTSLTVLGTTPSSISVSWNSNNNSSSATYQVTYSTDNFVTHVSTPLAFSKQSNQTALVLSSLLTGTTISIRVAAQNLSGLASAFSNTVTTAPFNGGVPAGSLGGTVLTTQNNIIEGTLGNSRYVKLTVPAKSFASDVFVTVSSFTVPPSPCGAGGANIGLSITPRPTMQPVGPVFLTFSFADAELAAVPIPAGEATFMRVDDSGACVPLQTVVDSVNHRMTVQLNHFSQFQVVRVSPSTSVEQARVFPNPFMPNRGHGYVTFSQMPAGARVRVFTLRGELVFEGQANGSGLMIWGGVNLYGRPAASGVYLATLEFNGQKKVHKVVVLR
ncbi:MAG: fibronectin type III domain-containing protein [Elusimicrobia bacterium]|nr:fibronectin type III domain-containing protein [Elusimicrobiota bacterium]